MAFPLFTHSPFDSQRHHFKSLIFSCHNLRENKSQLPIPPSIKTKCLPSSTGSCDALTSDEVSTPSVPSSSVAPLLVLAMLQTSPQLRTFTQLFCLEPLNSQKLYSLHTEHSGSLLDRARGQVQGKS